MIYALIAVIAIITFSLVLLRTNSGVVFLAVCAGSVLLNAFGKDTNLLANSFGSTVSVSTNALQAAFVLMPGVVSALLLRKRVPKSRILLAVIPAFCTAVVGLTLVYPFLSGSFQNTLVDSKGWSLIAQFYELVVIVGIVSSLTIITFTIPKHHQDKHKKVKH